jgi:hypothetical protein
LPTRFSPISYTSMQYIALAKSPYPLCLRGLFIYIQYLLLRLNRHSDLLVFPFFI